jgi:hypothetical protein
MRMSPEAFLFAMIVGRKVSLFASPRHPVRKPLQLPVDCTFWSNLRCDHPAAMLKELYENKHLTINEICETLKISRTTLYRYITPGKGDRAKL